MNPVAERFDEPWRATALRTGLLAAVIGAAVGLRTHHVATIIPASLLALWFTLGGHFVELLFRNGLRRSLDASAIVLLLARIAYWFAGGAILFEGALATRTLFAMPVAMPFSWWQAGAGFVGIELVIHLGLRARGQANVYDGRG